jgi:hypothetical protein
MEMEMNMSIKLLFIIAITIVISSCATEPKPLSTNFDSESFYHNNRIVFRDVTVRKLSHRHTYTFNNNLDSNARLHSGLSTLKVNAVYPISKAMYGSSIDDSFNGVPEVFVIRPHTNRFPSNPIRQDFSSEAKKLDSRSFGGSENYLPLSFPAAPPQTLIDKFHMQISNKAT